MRLVITLTTLTGTADGRQYFVLAMNPTVTDSDHNRPS